MTRYKIDQCSSVCSATIAVSPDGEYVRYDDAMREIERLKATQDCHDELLAVLEDLMPFATCGVRKINSELVGQLYPGINLSKLERADRIIAKAKASK